ncbi:unnamed protein product [Enterobius vermicularis]|uniref:ANF_receptor domain-containing protein n=1 Tax=Enterobius vermicularis TaxID=51028 RepID=A0A0N4UUL3_ENTVE|nr:unnamed protein product [Enterobius vermicularis]
MTVGMLARYYNFPVIAWGTTMPTEIADPIMYPSLAAIAPVNYQSIMSFFALLKAFGWTDFAFIYVRDESNKAPRCSYLISDIEQMLPDTTNITMTYSEMLLSTTEEAILPALDSVKQRARIVAICTDNKRELMKGIMKSNMNTTEYVYVFLQTSHSGYGNPPFWESGSASDGMDQEIQIAASRTLIIDIFAQPNPDPTFSKRLLSAMKEPPFNCTRECNGYTDKVAERAFYLGDAMYVYGIALDRYLRENPRNWIHNGQAVIQSLEGNYLSFAGEFKIDKDGNRNLLYAVYGLNEDYKQTLFIKLRGNRTTTFFKCGAFLSSVSRLEIDCGGFVLLQSECLTKPKFYAFWLKLLFLLMRAYTIGSAAVGSLWRTQSCPFFKLYFEQEIIKHGNQKKPIVPCGLTGVGQYLLQFRSAAMTVVAVKQISWRPIGHTSSLELCWLSAQCYCL